MTDARDASSRRYDRASLLGEAKRNDVLTLEEVVRYGTDSFGDPDYVALYGLKPGEWYDRGVRILGRTAVECTPDRLADRIGRDVAAVAARERSLVIDPFAGSANTLFWVARHLRAKRAVGFELDRNIFDATRRNLAIVDSSIELRHVGIDAGLPTLDVDRQAQVVIFLAPPWGDALDPVLGLDLRRTQPPVASVLDGIARTFACRAVLVAIQIHETARRDSIAELRARCAWSELTIYNINDAGQNHGILIGCLESRV